MPTYDYVCDACEHAFEHWQSMTSRVLRTCPECKAKKLRRLIGSGAGVIFKGSGFYETDYKRRSSSKKGEKGEKGEKGTEKPSSAGEASTPGSESGSGSGSGDAKRSGSGTDGSKGSKGRAGGGSATSSTKAD